MKTSVIDVEGMLSVLSVDEVEKRIGEVPGVDSVTVNFAATSATVRYDETRLEVSDIKSAVRQRLRGRATMCRKSSGRLPQRLRHSSGNTCSSCFSRPVRNRLQAKTGAVWRRCNGQKKTSRTCWEP